MGRHGKGKRCRSILHRKDRILRELLQTIALFDGFILLPFREEGLSLALPLRIGIRVLPSIR